MDLAAQLRILEAAQGDPAKLALAAVDLAYPDLSEPERAVLKEALEAAATPHWCDEATLAALLGVSPEESAARLARLRGLKVLEPFPARGEGAVNVHEASRLALRKQMATEEATRFRALSSRAATLFERDLAPSGRIEWIYNLLCAEPKRGADELEKLGREWSSTAYPEDEYALATALRELEEQGLIQGRALLWSVLCCAWTRVSRGEEAALLETARRALELSQREGDRSAEADSQMLLGDVHEAKGQQDAAREAYGASLEICIRLAAEQPTNTGRQRELAVAHSRVGGVLEAQGKLSEAQGSFGEYLSISRRLAEQDPTNAGWQRDLAEAHSRVGDVLEAQGKLSGAQLSFEAYLSIIRRLTEQDPTNAGWQQDVAVAHSRVGGVLEARGKLSEAQSAFGECLSISRRLVEQDPTNAGWQRGLAVAHGRVGDVLQAQRKLSRAELSFEAGLSISRRLAEQDPTNAVWQRDLALALLRLARLEQTNGKPSGALPLFEEGLNIYRSLVQAAPDNPGWAQESEWTAAELASCRALLEQASE